MDLVPQITKGYLISTIAPCTLFVRTIPGAATVVEIEH